MKKENAKKLAQVNPFITDEKNEQPQKTFHEFPTFSEYELPGEKK